ncbi:tail fiber assembly protein [Enterobacter roggenkampii]|nr:tail fiber assembly protein [Enterobacter roggenkampii]
MINLKNFQPYTPKNPPFPGGMYLKAETGEDWYECQPLFAKDTLKVAYNSDDVIVSACMDVSALFPSGLSVAEVDASTVSDMDTLISGSWAYQDGAITAVVPTQAQEVANATSKKALLMRQCTDVIATLQDAVDLDMATDAEKTALTAWKKYRVLLNRVDTTKAPDIAWPDQPAT